MKPGRLSQERLEALAAQARAHLVAFTDPPTATIEVRALELEAVLEELVQRRARDERPGGGR